MDARFLTVCIHTSTLFHSLDSRTIVSPTGKFLARLKIHSSTADKRSIRVFHSLSVSRVKSRTLPDRNSDIAANCNTNSSVATSHDAEKPAGREKVVEPLTTNDVYCAGSIEHVRPDYRARERQQALLDRDLLQRAEGNQKVYPTTESQRDGTGEAREFLNERSRADEVEKIRSASRLKLVVRKVYLEDCGCSTLSRPVVTRLPLPCKPDDLIGRIFEADPSLTESCLIVMRRKFQVSIRNVCSCLNDVLGKLNIEASSLTTRTLHLSCEIRPGYISFRLKTGGDTRKCLFVARIPICQNVHKRTAPQDSAASFSNATLRGEIEESTCSERCEGNDTDFNETLACIKDESERIDDTCCSRLDQSLAEDTAKDTSRDKMESNNVEKTSLPYSIDENIPKRDYEFAICSRNKSSEKMVETVFEMMSHTGDPEARNEEHCKTLNSNVIDCDNKIIAEGRKETPESDNSIVTNNESAQLANDTNCACLPYGNLAETNNEVENMFNNNDILDRSDSLSQTADLEKHNWTCLSSNELDSRSTDCSRANTSSITSFVQNSERDKQLVELNCNRFSANNVVKTDERSNTVNTIDLLNSARAEIGCDSNCSCRYDDFIDITVIGDVSEDNARFAHMTFRNQSDATKPRDTICSGTTKISSKNNNSLTISVQTPRLKISSKGINVDISYPRTIAWLASGDDRSISSIVKTRDKCNEADFPSRSSAVPRKRDGVSHKVDREVFNTSGRTRGFIRSLRRRTESKKRLRSNADSRQLGASMKEDPRAGDYSTSLASDTSRTCRSFATGKVRKDKFQGSRESKKLHLRYVRASSSNGVRSVTSVTTVKYRTTPCKRQGDHSADVRPQAAFATNRFRKSVNKSVRWIKRLIRSKLTGAFFNQHRSKMTKMSRTFWGNDESGDVERQTVGYVRQGSCVTPCSNSVCRGRGCIISHVESSDVTLPCRRNWGKERNEGGMKLRDRRLAGGSEALSSFRSIDTTSPWSYDLLTLAPKDVEARELNGGGRWRLGREETKNKRGLINYKNSCSRDYGNCEESMTISLRSAAMSLADDESAEYFERGTRKQRKKPRNDSKRDRNRRANEEIQHHVGRRDDDRRKLREIRNADDEFSDLSFIRTDEGRNSRSRGMSKSINTRRLSSLGKNRETLDGAVETDRLRRRHVFALLADTCHDYARDLELEFESTLSRYVELCRNVKRSLMRTLWPDDTYEVSTASMRGSDS